MVLVVAAIGNSGSGKTTILEYLINRFVAKGYHVGAVKHIHHEDFTIDRTGTNTWRFAQAGAGVVVAVSPREIDIIKKTSQKFQDIDRVLGLLQDEKLDIVFIEGFHGLIAQRQDVVKIVTAKDQADLKSTLELIKRPIVAITGLVTHNSDERIFEGIPVVKVPKEGDKLVSLLLEELQK
ncbi:MAG: molybdopterin-guanine dinucleotide biosynthesis protein B [Nitrososphaerota archaeon]|jgi:molybdopterin-guanine dinucleotide biosynthesis protein MobB|uniref:molybdopterin-guanine dinucleotide biosynthesis protein B n=1 Tax=Candidatus Bathycorpusculum sp. TaxID=2994959 RepID=UPI0028317ADB|nr:molybdopterin-guanine dinucleotide biosynthesis protein B [Candidatus Termitimicrobium sp.]MCL2432742.1 molybdopterin-guanine dinucleotide biosynthesis protein B [Candidatus Termitimicrobium sp.]MDR0492905.1 molybdopterin-guanine dinucleotide biosynthesis protein B [Nitrososphaerota archaeon]